MKAMIIRGYGEPDVFELAELDPPEPGPGEVLVEVHGSSVNPLDAGIRRGLLPFLELRFPAVLGVDLAGKVVARGEGATRFEVGDRVYAYTGVGAGGGYGALASVAETSLARVPERLDLVEAGTVPGVGATAYEAFTVHAPIGPGSRVFVNGIAGGVGLFAVQVASSLGAEVAGTCSPGKAELVRRLGGAPIDYTRGDPFTGRGGYDVVLNAVRGTDEAALRGLLGPGGKLVTIVGASSESTSDRVSFYVSSDATCLEGLSELIAAGKVDPVVERIYPLQELAEAHRRVETGRVTGKVAIDVRSAHA